MTALDALLAEVEALDAKADAGPWTDEPGMAHFRMIDGQGGGTVAHGVWPDNAAFIARARTLLPLLREIVRVQGEALAEYGEHDRACIRSCFEGGRPTEGGGYESKYAGRWYESKPVDRTPKCDCGRDAALARAEALAQEVRDGH